MDDERKAWSRQFSSNIGPREFFRLGCVFMLWILLGGAIGVVLRSPLIIAPFLLAAFVFPVILHRWRPGYRFLRKILGNNDLPAEPMPRGGARLPAQARPWWSFLPGIWFWILTLIVLYLAIKVFSK